MNEKYICDCGAKTAVRRIVKSGLTNCPKCGEIIPHKAIMRKYRRPAERKYRRKCCGAEYVITPPTGEFQFNCPKCGRWLLSIRPRTPNGVPLPRDNEGVAESK